MKIISLKAFLVLQEILLQRCSSVWFYEEAYLMFLIYTDFFFSVEEYLNVYSTELQAG
jgi:hypothetical protein